jgi:hypothetical protein
MLRRRKYLNLLVWAAVPLLAWPALGERGTAPLQPGNALPALSGQTLSGKLLELPAAARNHVSVAIFSFSRAGGRDARKWAQQLSKDDPHVAIYNVIFLESVPRVLRSVVVSGIRNQMPSTMRDQTVFLYQQQTSWEQRLHIEDTDYACVVVLGRTGLIRSVSSGPFTDAIYARVQAALGPEAGGIVPKVQ